MTAYLVTDADLTALTAYRGPALVGTATRASHCNHWDASRFAKDGTDLRFGITLPEAIAFLRTACQADLIRAESTFKLPADPPIVVAFRADGYITTPTEFVLARVLKYAAGHGLRCVGGVETPERQGVGT